AQAELAAYVLARETAHHEVEDIGDAAMLPRVPRHRRVARGPRLHEAQPEPVELGRERRPAVQVPRQLAREVVALARARPRLAIRAVRRLPRSRQRRARRLERLVRAPERPLVRAEHLGARRARRLAVTGAARVAGREAAQLLERE